MLRQQMKNVQKKTERAYIQLINVSEEIDK